MPIEKKIVTQIKVFCTFLTGVVLGVIGITILERDPFTYYTSFIMISIIYYIFLSKWFEE